MSENAWRESNCPDYGYAYCSCPYYVQECKGAWNCEDISDVTVEVLAYYDTNSSGSINPEDAIEPEHYEMMV